MCEEVFDFVIDDEDVNYVSRHFPQYNSWDGQLVTPLSEVKVGAVSEENQSPRSFD